METELAVVRNPGLGAVAPTAGAIVHVIRTEPPKTKLPSDLVARGWSEGWRMPLSTLAQISGKSEDTCSRQGKQLATYTVADGRRVLDWEVVGLERPGF